MGARERARENSSMHAAMAAPAVAAMDAGSSKGIRRHDLDRLRILAVLLLTSKGAAYSEYQRLVPAFWPRPPRG